MQSQAASISDNGQERVRITPQVIVSKSPLTDSVLGQVHIPTQLQIRQVMEDARIGQIAWEGIGLPRRLYFLNSLRDTLYRWQDRIITMLVEEQGKVRQEAVVEFLAAIELLHYYGEHANAILAMRPVPSRLLEQRAFHTVRRPYGVVLVISPWNYPLFLSLGPIAAAIAAGNSVVYKPSEHATQVGEIISAIVHEAGIPDEVFQIVHGYGDVGAALIEAHPDRIVFTGSVPTGKKIARAAAEHLIPVTLELGGKDAAIVLADADIQQAAAGIVWSGMFNAGQTCASVERVFVVRSVAEQLLAAMQAVIDKNLHGPNGQPTASLATMTTGAQIEIVDSQVREAVEAGAKIVIGGHRLDNAGRYYAPTILTNVTPDMRISQEETFGPVITVTSVENAEEAIAAANDSTFGLTASIWTRNRQRGLQLAQRLQVGSVSINEHLMASGVPETPWGGIKESGYGQTQGAEGLLQMTYPQTINVDRFKMPFEVFWYPYTAFKQNLFKRFIHVMYGPGWRDKVRGLLP